MLSKRKFTFSNIIICEYVRSEVNNKHTIIGAMPSSDIEVAEFPATFIVAFYIEVIFSEPGNHTTKIIMSYNKKRLGVLSVTMNVTNANVPGIIAFPTIPVAANEPGILELRSALEENGPSYRIFKKSVKLSDNPNLASAPPL